MGESSCILRKGAYLKRLWSQALENALIFVTWYSVDGFVVVSVKAHGRLIKLLPNLPILIVLASATTINNAALILLLHVREVLSPSFVQEVLFGIFVQKLLLTVVHHSIWRYLQLACWSSNRLLKLDIIVLIFLLAYTFVDLRRHVASIITIKGNVLEGVILLDCLHFFQWRVLLFVFGHWALSV